MSDDLERFVYHKYLDEIVTNDVEYVAEKDVSYGASWKKRGGVGAFMMLARKWDRLEEMVKKRGYDVFKAIEHGGLEGEDGTAIAEVRDLRRYLLLLEAEMLHQEVLEHRSQELEREAFEAIKTLEDEKEPSSSD